MSNHQYTSNEKFKYRINLYEQIRKSPPVLYMSKTNTINMNVKYIELVGDDALCIKQLKTEFNIDDSQIIGVDIRKHNITKCKKLFPGVTFINKSWSEIMWGYTGNDLGFIMYDSCDAAYGVQFIQNLEATLYRALKCAKKLGACIVHINVDYSKTYREIKASDDRCAKQLNRQLSPEENLKYNIENVLNNMLIKGCNNLNLQVIKFYKYTQENAKEMMMGTTFTLYGRGVV
jgi:hypothetical protein